MGLQTLILQIDLDYRTEKDSARKAELFEYLRMLIDIRDNSENNSCQILSIRR